MYVTFRSNSMQRSKYYCQTFENTFAKRLKTPLSTLENTFVNVGKHLYQTLDNTLIKRWIILLSGIGNSPDKHEQDILWWSMVVEVWPKHVNKKSSTTT